MFERYFLAGDIHGSSKHIQGFYNNYKDSFIGGETWIILLGDSGLNFRGNKRDDYVKSELSKLPFNYFVIRGNHDRRPSNLQSMRKARLFDGDVFVEEKYPRIFYAQDTVSLYNIAGNSVLVIPGAYSVDKFYLITNRLRWFSDEQLTNSEMSDGLDLLNKIGWKCDVVLSHTCPIGFMPTDLFLRSIDQSFVDNSMERYLGKIEFKLDYKLWAWGHYHAYRMYPKDGNKQKVMLFKDKFIDMKDWLNGRAGEYYTTEIVV